MSGRAPKPTPHADEDLLTVADVAKQCQVSERTVRRWIADEGLKVVRPGPRLIRIRPRDLRDFLNRNS